MDGLDLYQSHKSVFFFDFDHFCFQFRSDRSSIQNCANIGFYFGNFYSSLRSAFTIIELLFYKTTALKITFRFLLLLSDLIISTTTENRKKRNTSNVIELNPISVKQTAVVIEAVFRYVHCQWKQCAMWHNAMPP